MADPLEERENPGATKLAKFNKELGQRLASLDRGETVDPDATRARLQRKSRDCG